MFGLFGPPSRKKFGELVLKKLRSAGGPSDYVFDEKAFTINREGQRGFLENAYATYCQAKAEMREVILHNFVTMLLPQKSADVSFEEIQSNLVLVVRERALFASVSFLQEPDLKKVAKPQQIEPISDWFAQALVIDAPTHMALVTEEQVKNWGLLPSEAYAIGLERLRESKPPHFSEDNGVFTGQWNDDYDSSRILVPGLFDDLPLKGDPVVTIPNRLTLLVAGSDDEDGLRRMLARAEEIIRTVARPQNPAPLLVRDGVVSDFSVDGTSPLFNDVLRAKRLAELSYYDEQQHNLEIQLEKKGRDVYVGKYTLTENSNEAVRYRSHSVWSFNVPTLLPVTDDVIFCDSRMPEGQTIVGQGSWKSVEAVLGDLMLDAKMFPRRFYVSKFPTKEQLAQISAKS